MVAHGKYDGRLIWRMTFTEYLLFHYSEIIHSYMMPFVSKYEHHYVCAYALSDYNQVIYLTLKGHYTIQKYQINWKRHIYNKDEHASYVYNIFYCTLQDYI